MIDEPCRRTYSRAASCGVAALLHGGGDAGDLRKELGEVEWLFDDIRRSKILGVGVQIARGGKQDERDVLVARAELLRELPAIHHRHHQVEHDDVRTERADRGERLLTVRRGEHFEALVFERREQQLTYVGVV